HPLTFATEGFGAAAIHVDQAINGNGALLKTGSGILFLSHSNSYSGPTLLQAGLTEIENNFALGSTSSGTTVSNLASLIPVNALAVPEPLTLVGTLFVHGATNVWTGPILLTVSNATVAVSLDSRLTIDGVISGSGGL